MQPQPGRACAHECAIKCAQDEPNLAYMQFEASSRFDLWRAFVCRRKAIFRLCTSQTFRSECRSIWRVSCDSGPSQTSAPGVLHGMKKADGRVSNEQSEKAVRC